MQSFPGLGGQGGPQEEHEGEAAQHLPAAHAWLPGALLPGLAPRQPGTLDTLVNTYTPVPFLAATCLLYIGHMLSDMLCALRASLLHSANANGCNVHQD